MTIDTNTILLIVGVVVLLWAVSRFMNRGSSNPATPTYDDKNTRSGGSLGGQQRAESRANNDPNIRSGGTLGGQRREESAAANRVNQRDDDDDNDTPRRANDDPNIRSGGSFGG